MTSAPLRIEGMALTDVGRVRDLNEDCYCALPHSGIWVVADGMGGHERGDLASAAIVSSVAAISVDGDFNSALAAVAEAIHEANRSIHAEAQAAGVQMGSTVVAAVLRERQFGVLWAGDSRAYLFRNGQLHRLTKDHTQVQQMVDSGLLTSEAAEGHPMGHVLARAVGVAPDLELDAIVDQAEAGDLFLLCSDGLHGVVEEAEIARLLADPAARAAPERLIGASLSKGAPDNVTVIIIAATEATQLRFEPPEGALAR
jgi:serine/threonine protein phosphatase PrpC